MFVPDVKVTLGTAMVLVSPIACVGPREAPGSADRGGERAEIGEARETLCYGQRIVNVTVLPETYRWEDPAHLIDAAEGFGPRIINLAVSASVVPTLSVIGTGTFTPATPQPSSGAAGSSAPASGQPSSGITGDCAPSISLLSEALGFSVTEVSTLTARSTFFVPTAAFARVSAYPIFQKITWDVVSASGWSWGGATPASVVVSSGVALRPIGVYFATYCDYDLSAIGGGVIDPGPILDPGGGGAGPGGDSGSGGGAGGAGAGGAGATGGADGAGGSGGGS
ncbi:hypothetical protein WMF30_11525 [Sorangium sp. So ce134]